MWSACSRPGELREPGSNLKILDDSWNPKADTSGVQVNRKQMFPPNHLETEDHHDLLQTISGDMYSRFSSNYGAFASELLDNME